MKINLEWTEPCTFNEILRIATSGGEHDDWQKLNGPGVYAQIDRSKKRVRYVGKSQSSLLRRNAEHARGLLGGLGHIPEEYFKECPPGAWLRSYPFSTRKGEAQAAWRDLYCRVLTHEEYFIAMHRSARVYMDNIEIYFSVVPEKAVIARVERELIRMSGVEGQKHSNTLRDPDFEVSGNHPWVLSN